MSSKLSSIFRRNLKARTALIGIATLSMFTAARTASANTWSLCPPQVCNQTSGPTPKVAAPSTAPLTLGSNQLAIAPVYAGTGCTWGSNTHGCWLIRALVGSADGSGNYAFAHYSNSASGNSWVTTTFDLLGLFDSTTPSNTTTNLLYGWGTGGKLWWWSSSAGWNAFGFMGATYDSYVPDIPVNGGTGNSWATATQTNASGNPCGAAGYPSGDCLEQYTVSTNTWSAIHVDATNCYTNKAGGDQITVNRQSAGQWLLDSSGAIWSVGFGSGTCDYDTFNTTSQTVCSGSGSWPAAGMVQIAATGSSTGNTKLFALSNTSTHGTIVWTSYFTGGSQGCWTNIGAPTGSIITSIATPAGISNSDFLVFGVDEAGTIYVWS